MIFLCKYTTRSNWLVYCSRVYISGGDWLSDGLLTALLCFIRLLSHTALELTNNHKRTISFYLNHHYSNTSLILCLFKTIRQFDQLSSTYSYIHCHYTNIYINTKLKFLILWNLKFPNVPAHVDNSCTSTVMVII